MALNEFWEYLNGPRLYRIFRFRDSPGRPYVGNSIEIYSDNVIKIVSVLRSVALYSSPILMTYLYKKGYISSDNNYLLFNYSFIRIATTLSIVFFSAFIIRGIGRSTNNDYKSFLKILNESKKNDTGARLTLSQFDFDFNYWPIDYRWYDSRLSDPSKPPTLLTHSRHTRRSTVLDSVKKVPCDLLSYVVVHTVGKRMLYPGSVWLLQKAIQNVLIDGRTKLIEEQNGKRYKLLARDSNHIDCLFVDKRNTNSLKGRTLVICSEGNAGFYEIGTLGTPLEAGYSVLGWNHPGFGGSTGSPFPLNDINAIDVVINFAVEKLGFKLNEILLFAWSIGGFPASWVAMQYPDIKGLVLDASFDDILPLAESKMPQTLKPIVRNTIRNYFNLNISAHLSLYNGPVLFIRRLREEIIITDDLHSIRTNRGNDLLIKLFQSRFPKLMADENVKSVLLQWLTNDINTQTSLQIRYNVSEDYCLTQLVSYMESNGAHYPLHIGDDKEMSTEAKIKLILYSAQKHMKDFDSTHCTPLPARLFQEPFNLFVNFSDKINSNL